MVNISRVADLMEVGSNGAGFVGDIGTTSPGDPAIQPGVDWSPLGMISDDGLVQGFDEDSQAFTPWGLTSPIRTTITKSLRTFKITAWETSRTTVQSLQYRKSVDDLAPTGGITRFSETASPIPDRRAWWFIVIDGDTMHGFYCPQAEISDRSDVTHKQDSVAGYEWTITCYPDESNNTVYHASRVAATPEYTGS